MQAITTKFIPATNTKGSRYKAFCDAGSIVVGCDYALNSEQNHIAAARKLIDKLGWFHDESRQDRYGDWHYGGTKDGYVFVCCLDYTKVER